MTTAQHIASNPFALMMNPEAVFAAMAGSDPLSRLQSRVCRPLDKPASSPTAIDAQSDGEIDAFGETVGDVTA